MHLAMTPNEQHQGQVLKLISSSPLHMPIATTRAEKNCCPFQHKLHRNSVYAYSLSFPISLGLYQHQQVAYFLLKFMR
jgi:hypothetical protein